MERVKSLLADINSDRQANFHMIFNLVFSLSLITVSFSIAKTSSGLLKWEKGKYTSSSSFTNSPQDSNQINVRAFGAKADYNPATKTGSDNTPAFQKALQKGSIFVPKGLYYFNILNSSQSVNIPSNRTLTFEEGATVVFGMQDIYFPAFVIVGKNNIHFKNPSFIWTGKLTFGEGKDNLDPNEASNESKRFATKNAYLNRHYCSAIWLAESNNIYINNFKGNSITMDGNSVIYNWIHAVRVDNLFIDGCEMNDMLLGVMSQGGKGGKISNITADRMSQDVGIPGHVIYSFRLNCPISNVVDLGTETSITDKRISHTISVKNRSNITNITSSRSEGVLNIATDSSISFSNISWKENPNFTSKSKTPKLYLITSSKNNNLFGNNVTLEAFTDGVSELFGGHSNNSTFSNFKLIRNDNLGTQNYGFFNLKGSNNLFEAELIERGNRLADIVKNFNGSSSNNEFSLTLTNFPSDPIIRVNKGSKNNKFKIKYKDGLKRGGSGQIRNLIFDDSSKSNHLEFIK